MGGATLASRTGYEPPRVPPKWAFLVLSRIELYLVPLLYLYIRGLLSSKHHDSTWLGKPENRRPYIPTLPGRRSHTGSHRPQKVRVAGSRGVYSTGGLLDFCRVGS